MNWAFMLDRKRMKMALDLVPKDIDVFISHGPPYGILDECKAIYTDNIEHVGCRDLLNAIKEIKPKYHIFGHIHEGYGEHMSKKLGLDKTKFINASTVDENYRRVNKPIVIEI